VVADDRIDHIMGEEPIVVRSAFLNDVAVQDF
jgi:hypothetical protein